MAPVPWTPPSSVSLSMPSRELRIAVADGNLSLVKKLTQAANSPFRLGTLRNPDTETGWPSLFYAIQFGQDAVAEWLLEMGHETNGLSSDFEGNTALMMAAMFRRDRIFRKYLSLYPAATHLANSHGLTCVMVVCMHGLNNLLETLIESEVSLAVRDNLGNSPLHYAASWGHSSTCALLLERGADPLDKNYAGWTPVDYAFTTRLGEELHAYVMSSGSYDVARLLSSSPSAFTPITASLVPTNNGLPDPNSNSSNSSGIRQAMSAGRANISNALGGLVARGAAAVQSAVARNPATTSFGALPELPSQTSNASFGRAGGGSWGKAAGSRLSGGRRGSAQYGPGGGGSFSSAQGGYPPAPFALPYGYSLPQPSLSTPDGGTTALAAMAAKLYPAAAVAELESGGGLSGSPEMLSPADAESRGRSPRGSSVSGSSRRGSPVCRAASEDGSDAGERWLVTGGRARTGHARSKSEGGVPASPADARMDFGKRGVGAFGEKLLEEDEEGGEVPPLPREESGI